MTVPVLDLLRERRQALGLEPMAPLLAAQRPLLRRGTVIGAALLGTVLGIGGLLLLRHAMVRAQMGELEHYEAEAARMRTLLTARKGKLDRLRDTNRRLAESLTTLRTSSALLTELQLRTPEGVQLVGAQSKGAQLVLKGRAADPMAFARINALELELKRSPLLAAEGVALSKVERQPAKDAAAAGPGSGRSALPAGPPPVGFEMVGPFAALGPARQLEVLRQLGSDGMASRLERLQQEGLMP